MTSVSEDLGGGVDRRQLEFLFGFEMRIEPALAHPNVLGQVADGKPTQAADSGQAGRGVEDGAAGLDTVSAACGKPAGSNSGPFRFSPISCLT